MTGVQTCALPISLYSAVEPVGEHLAPDFGFAALADRLGNKVVAAKRAIEPANVAD